MTYKTLMTRQLSKKSVILALTGLAVTGLACTLTVKTKEKAKVNEYPDEYQEEAYSIGQQEEDYSKQK
ncbi:hypothetical protein C7B67_08515 [filamentous cyanobacterium Phorm 6]|nr:hypothetical protein C7B67_08515 [filamentous cyanobacterium Phorm 6]